MPYAATPTATPQQIADRATEFALAHPAEMEWLAVNMERGNDFARSLAQHLDRTGSLTDKQLLAVQNNVARAGMRPEAPVISVAAIEAKFDIARSNLIKKPTMRLDTFLFKAAGKDTKNAGGIYVTEKRDGEAVYLGKVLGGKFIRTRECSDDQQARIIAAAANPEEAAMAYGQRTGNCSICGLELTAAESLERFVGPICWGKYGFGG